MHFQKRLLSLCAIDALIVTLALMTAYLLRFDFVIKKPYFDYLHVVITIHVVLTITLFHRSKMYRRVWQYASIGELVSLFKAASVAEIIFYVINNLIQDHFPSYIVPRSIYPITWALIILGVGGSRFYWRMFRDSYLKLPLRINMRRTLIIGAGKAGAILVNELKQSPEAELYPVAFIDDDKGKWNLELMGLPVLGGREKIQEVVSQYNIQKIVVALPSAPKTEIAKILEICKNTGAMIKILPRVADLIDSRVSVNMIREVQVEDLLGREPVQVDLEGIANYVTNQVVLVTGAGGSIGSELCRQISPFKPQKLLLLGHGENSIYDIELELRKAFPDLPLKTVIADVQDRMRIKEVFTAHRPSVVFHAAAHKHVPLMERDPAEAVKNNILGTRNVAECAHESGAARFVMISTDKAVNPTSVMGVTKRVAEMIVQSLGRSSQTKFVAVRFGNVLGSRGSVIPIFKRQIQEGGPVTVTHPEMVRYFMTIPEAVQLVIQAGSFARGGEVFILDMGAPVKISELARDLIRLSGLEPDKDIEIQYTGIRPGEKLFEEILTNEEGITATKHNRIFVGKPSEICRESLEEAVGRLWSAAYAGETASRGAEIRAILKAIVPTFQQDTEKFSAEAKGKLTRASKELAKKEIEFGEVEVAVAK